MQNQKSIKDKLEQIMQLAIKEAVEAEREGEVPVGAVIVDAEFNVIASDHNRTVQLSDPTAHAEILVLRKAGSILGNYRLTECTLVVTKEPCVMCAGAIVNARIKRLVFGTKDDRYGACGSVFSIVPSKLLNHRPEVTSGILEEECRRLLKAFFLKKREKR